MKLFDYKYKCSYSTTQIFHVDFLLQLEIVKIAAGFIEVSVLFALPISLQVDAENLFAFH